MLHPLNQLRSCLARHGIIFGLLLLNLSSKRASWTEGVGQLE